MVAWQALFQPGDAFAPAVESLHRNSGSARRSSGVMAGYVTPAAMPIIRKWLDAWSCPAGDIEGSVGFALGLVGMAVCDAVIRWARRWRDGPLPFPPSR